MGYGICDNVYHLIRKIEHSSFGKGIDVTLYVGAIRLNYLLYLYFFIETVIFAFIENYFGSDFCNFSFYLFFLVIELHSLSSDVAISNVMRSKIDKINFK